MNSLEVSPEAVVSSSSACMSGKLLRWSVRSRVYGYLGCRYAIYSHVSFLLIDPNPTLKVKDGSVPPMVTLPEPIVGYRSCLRFVFRTYRVKLSMSYCFWFERFGIVRLDGYVQGIPG